MRGGSGCCVRALAAAWAAGLAASAFVQSCCVVQAGVPMEWKRAGSRQRSWDWRAVQQCTFRGLYRVWDATAV